MKSHNLLGPEQSVPLSDILGLDPMNARSEKTDVGRLKASLRSRGQISPLILRRDPSERGRSRVLAGGRRWEAFVAIAAESADDKLHVRARHFNGDDVEALALSIAENVEREALHALDEAERFVDLAASTSVDAIAKEFGVPKKHVRERLALGRLSPKVRAAWRAGRLTHEVAKIFTIASDHEAQDRALEDLLAAPYVSPADIATRLRGDAVPASHPNARFLGAADYVAAGGAVSETLFDEQAWFLDRALLERLAARKLDHAAEAIRAAEGWGFAWTSDREGRLWAAAKPDYLIDEMDLRDAAKARFEAAADVATVTAALEEMEAIDEKAILRAIRGVERNAFGILVTLDPDGASSIERGLRFKSAPEAAAAAAGESGEQSEPARAPPGLDPGVSAKPTKEQRDARRQPRAAPDAFPLRVPPAARRIAETAANRALDAALGANVALARVLALIGLARPASRDPIGLHRHAGPRGAKLALTLQVGRSRRLRDALELAAAADPEHILAALYDCVAAAVDLRGCDEGDSQALIEIAARFSPALRTDIAANFDYASYFREAGRLPALAAIGELTGEAGERSASWKKDAALAEEAALLARARAWLPEWLRAGGGAGEAIQAAE